MELWKFYFHPVSILELIIVTQTYVSGDFDDIPWMMSRPFFVLIGAKQKRLVVEYPARNDANRHPAAILMSFEAYDIGGK